MSPSSNSSDQKLSRSALIALVVGSMIGSGTLALPSAFGRATGALGALIAWIRGAVATIYAAGMIYAGGAKFLLLSALLYAPGTALFIIAWREQKKTAFTLAEPLLLSSSRLQSACTVSRLAPFRSGAL